MDLRGGAACKQELLMRFSSGLPHAICNTTLSCAPSVDRAIAVEPDSPWKRRRVFQSAGLGGRSSGLCDRACGFCPHCSPISSLCRHEVGAMVTLLPTVSVMGTKILM